MFLLIFGLSGWHGFSLGVPAENLCHNSLRWEEHQTLDIIIPKDSILFLFQPSAKVLDQPCPCVHWQSKNAREIVSKNFAIDIDVLFTLLFINSKLFDELKAERKTFDSQWPWKHSEKSEDEFREVHRVKQSELLRCRLYKCLNLCGNKNSGWRICGGKIRIYDTIKLATKDVRKRHDKFL